MMAEPTHTAFDVALRLEIIALGETIWMALVARDAPLGEVFPELLEELALMLGTQPRLIEVQGNDVKELRERLHQPSDDLALLSGLDRLDKTGWQTLDLNRSALERDGPVVLLLSSTALWNLSNHAPNIKSFLGTRIFPLAPENVLMTDEERAERLDELAKHYRLSGEQVIQQAEAGELPTDPNFVEWLVLLDRGDLV